jgi:HEPN domain-containing protein
MQQRDLALLLMAKAAEDERLVAKLYADSEISDEIIGFHCQQAAEKLLKSLLAEKGSPVERTHDLLYLRQVLEDIGYHLPVTEQDLNALTPFAVGFRYESIESHSTFDREWARYLVAQLRDWVEAQILGV